MSSSELAVLIVIVAAFLAFAATFGMGLPALRFKPETIVGAAAETVRRARPPTPDLVLIFALVALLI